MVMLVLNVVGKVRTYADLSTFAIQITAALLKSGKQWNQFGLQSHRGS